MIKKIKDNLVDILVITALFIIVSTTLIINVFIGLYLLAFVLIAIAIILSRYR